MLDKAILRRVLAAVLVALSATQTHADVFNMGGTFNPTTGTWTGLASLEFVTVGDAGNAADTRFDAIGYGAVANTYQIGKYDVTVGQYVQFLNAVAATDTYGLYNSYMATDYFDCILALIGCNSFGNNPFRGLCFKERRSRWNGDLRFDWRSFWRTRYWIRGYRKGCWIA